MDKHTITILEALFTNQHRYLLQKHNREIEELSYQQQQSAFLTLKERYPHLSEKDVNEIALRIVECSKYSPRNSKYSEGS